MTDIKKVCMCVHIYYIHTYTHFYRQSVCVCVSEHLEILFSLFSSVLHVYEEKSIKI